MANGKTKVHEEHRESKAGQSFLERLRAWMHFEVTTEHLKPGMRVGRLNDSLNLSIPFRVLEEAEHDAFVSILRERIGQEPSMSGIVLAKASASEMKAYGIGGYAKMVFTEDGIRYIIVLPDDVIKAIVKAGSGDMKAIELFGRKVFQSYARAYERMIAEIPDTARVSFMTDLMNGTAEGKISQLKLDLATSPEFFEAMEHAAKTGEFRFLGILCVAEILEHEYMHSQDQMGFEEKERAFRQNSGELLRGLAIHPTIIFSKLMLLAEDIDQYVDYLMNKDFLTEIAQIAGAGSIFKPPPKQMPVSCLLCGVHIATELKSRGVSLNDKKRASMEIVALIAEEIEIELKREPGGMIDCAYLARRHSAEREAFFANPTHDTAIEYAKLEMLAGYLGISTKPEESEKIKFSGEVSRLLDSAKHVEKVGYTKVLQKTGREYFSLLYGHAVERVQFKAVTESKAFAFVNRTEVPGCYPEMFHAVSARLRAAIEIAGIDPVKARVAGITDLAEFHSALRELGVKEAWKPEDESAHTEEAIA